MLLDKVHRLHFWCQKVLPLVYDDSLSYYELLCKVVKYLNDHTELINTLIDFYNNFNDDVEEVLREMFNNGELDSAIVDTLSPIIANEYDPTEEYSKGDYILKDGKLYQANKDTTGDWNENDWDEINISEALININAKFESVYINIKNRGAVGDGVTDDTTAIQNTINEAYQNNKRVFIPEGTFLITSPLVIPSENFVDNELIIEGMGKVSHIIKNQASTYDDVDTVFYSATSDLKRIYNIKITNNVTNGYCIYMKAISGVILDTLWLSGYYGIYNEGWLCTTRNITGNTSNTLYRDGETGNVVENIYAHNTVNPFRLGSSAGSYIGLNAEACTGTIVTLAVFSGLTITSCNFECPNAEHIIETADVGTDITSVIIDTMVFSQLAAEKIWFSLYKGLLEIKNLICFRTDDTNVANTIVDYHNVGNPDLIIHNLFLDRINQDNITIRVNNTSYNLTKINTPHSDVFAHYSSGGTIPKIYTLGHGPALDTNKQGEPLKFANTPSVILGGWVDGLNNSMFPKFADDSDARYLAEPMNGSLFINDLTKDNSKGIAGFVKTGSFVGTSADQKAPIPIFLIGTKASFANTPYFNKQGILWFDTENHTFNIRVSNGWYKASCTFEADT